MTNALTRRALLGAGLFGLVGCGQPPPATGNKIPSGTSNTPRLRLIGEATLPHRMDFQGTVVGAGCRALTTTRPAACMCWSVMTARS